CRDGWPPMKSTGNLGVSRQSPVPQGLQSQIGFIGPVAKDNEDLLGSHSFIAQPLSLARQNPRDAISLGRSTDGQAFRVGDGGLTGGRGPKERPLGDSQALGPLLRWLDYRLQEPALEKARASGRSRMVNLGHLRVRVEIHRDVDGTLGLERALENSEL